MMQLLELLKFSQNKQRTLCVDFGESFIKVAALENRGNKHHLLAYGLLEFGATLKTSQDVSHFLRQLLESNALRGNQVALSVSDPDGIFIKKLNLPQMPKGQWLDVVKSLLKEEAPFDLNESISDFQVTGESVDAQGTKKIQLLCVFAKKEVINKYIQAVTSCGLLANWVSTSVFNYCGTLHSLESNHQISAILDVAGTHSYVAVYQDNKLNFVKNLNFSTEKLRSALVGVLATDKGRVEITVQKAKDFLAQFGVISDERAVLDKGVKASQIMALILPALEMLVKELQAAFEDFKAQNALSLPQVLYITGGGANLKHLDTYLASQLKIKVIPLPLPGSLDTGKVDVRKFSLEANQLSGVLGLAVTSTGINLLPPEIENQKRELKRKSAFRVMLATVAAIFVFSWMMVNLEIQDYRQRLRIAKTHLQNVEVIKSVKEIVDLREGLIDSIHDQKVPVVGLLKLISAIIPASIILDEFDFDQSGHQLWLKGVVTLSADAAEKALADFMQELEGSEFVQVATLVNAQEDLVVNSFKIKCDLVK